MFNIPSFVHIKNLERKNALTPSIIFYEAYKRIAALFDEEKGMQATAYMLAYTTEIQLDSHLAVVAAQMSRTHKLGMADEIIAATAQTNNAQIISSDQDLAALPCTTFVPKK